jgi:hypothetical protein
LASSSSSPNTSALNDLLVVVLHDTEPAARVLASGEAGCLQQVTQQRRVGQLG